MFDRSAINFVHQQVKGDKKFIKHSGALFININILRAETLNMYRLF